MEEGGKCVRGLRQLLWIAKVVTASGLIRAAVLLQYRKVEMVICG